MCVCVCVCVCVCLLGVFVVMVSVGTGSVISIQLGLTWTFRASCYNTRLSWAHTPVISWAVCLGQNVSS